MRVLIAALVASTGFVAVSVFALRPADDEPDEKATGHAETACSLTSKADEAARVDTGARYAAAVLLLDNAIIESARAAGASPRFVALDQAVQALHTAAHQGRPAQWRDALDTALTACQEAAR